LQSIVKHVIHVQGQSIEIAITLPQIARFCSNLVQSLTMAPQVYHLPPLCHAVTLMFDLLTLNSCVRSVCVSRVVWPNCVPNLSKIDQSAAELLTILHYFQGAYFQTLLLRGGGPTVLNLERAEIHYRCTEPKTLVPICTFVLKWGQLRKEWCQNRSQIPHVVTPVKIRGGWGKMLSGMIELTVRPNLWNTFDGWLLCGVED